MPIRAEAVKHSIPVDPAKLLAIVRQWCPGAPVEVPITLVKTLIEAAASGSSGDLRLGLLEEFVVGLVGQLCSNFHKINKLKQETVRMAGDPLHRPKLRPSHPAALTKAALAAIQRAPDQVLRADQVHSVLRRVKPKISFKSTYSVLKRMTDSGFLERDNAGVYRLPNSSKKSYEPRTIQLLRLVYEAPNHKMSVRQAESALDWSQKLLSATASELGSRSLLKYENCELAVPGEIVERVERGEGVRIAPGKMFYGRASGPRVDVSAFTTLRLERPRVDLAQEILDLRMRKKRELDSALDEAAPRLGIPRTNLEIMVKPPPATAKAAQRRKTQSAAEEQLRAELLRLVGEHTEAPPTTKDDLCEWYCSPASKLKISGLTREIFRDVWAEVAPPSWRKRGPRASKFRPKISS